MTFLSTTRGKAAAGAMTLALVGSAGFATYALAGRTSDAPPELVAELKREFPATTIDQVSCDIGVKGLCEVVSGRTVFYSTRDGRHVFVGALLDLKAKVDLTDKRIRELAALTNATARITGASAPAAQPAAAGAPAAKLNVSLKRDSAIIHNPGAPLKLTVFSDLNCGYCRQLFAELKDAPDIEVTEYPIAILGADSAEKAKMALCADNRAKAANALYFGGDVEVPADCKDAAQQLARNMAFAEANGIAGTPALIRSDGAVNRGWMALGELRGWLKAERS